jgi:hypothetical protein
VRHASNIPLFRLVTALALGATASGCTAGNDPSPSDTGPTALTSPTCRTYARTGQKIGITIPTGFTIRDAAPDYVGPVAIQG